MALLEVEVWDSDRDGDFATVFDNVDPLVADDLYGRIVALLADWLAEAGADPTVYERTKGRDYHVSVQLGWLVDEGFLEPVEVESETWFQPAPDVAEAMREQDEGKELRLQVEVDGGGSS